MKHFSTLLLALGLTASAVSAQNVIVVMKDGSSQKFNADYLKEITFVDANTETESVTFDKLNIKGYSSGYMELHFVNEEKNITLNLDAYGPKDALFLNEGTYTFNETYAPMTIDTDKRYTNLVEGDNDPVAITGGTVVITRSEDVYTAKIDITL